MRIWAKGVGKSFRSKVRLGGGIYRAVERKEKWFFGEGRLCECAIVFFCNSCSSVLKALFVVR